MRLKDNKKNMWPSEATASLLFNIANGSLIAGLILGAAATVVVVWMGNVKEEYLKRELAESHERAAELNEKAEAEKLARVKLEQRLAPRHITQEQQNTIASKLAEFKGQRVLFGVSPSTDESQWFVRWLAAPFSSAGWKVEMGAHPNEMRYVHAGVVVETSSDARAIAVANKVVEALEAEGIKASTVPLHEKAADPQRLLIVVGSKESSLDYLPAANPTASP